MILADNKNSLSINGGFNTVKDYPFSSVKNVLIIGKGMENCTFCYDNPTDCQTNGLITSIFEINKFELFFNDYVLPLHNITFTDHQWGGK
jgi:hypothetical protein